MRTSERAIYFVDRDLRIITANPVALTHWGKSFAEVVNRALPELFPQAVGGEVHKAMMEALHSFRTIRFSTNSLVTEGRVEVEIYPVNDGLQIVLVYSG